MSIKPAAAGFMDFIPQFGHTVYHAPNIIVEKVRETAFQS